MSAQALREPRLKCRLLPAGLEVLALALLLGCAPRLESLPILGRWKVERCVYSKLPKQDRATAMRALGKTFEIAAGSVDLSAMSREPRVFFNAYTPRPVTAEELRGLSLEFDAARREPLQALVLTSGREEALVFFYGPASGLVIFSWDGALYLAHRLRAGL